MKKYVSRFVVTIMVVIMMGSTAFAGSANLTPTNIDPSVIITTEGDQSGTEDLILSIAEKANEDIAKEIQKAQIKAEKVKSEAQLDFIIEKLLNKTSKIVSKAIIKIDKLGGEAVCEYVEVQIGDRVVLVDPLRIVRL